MKLLIKGIAILMAVTLSSCGQMSKSKIENVELKDIAKKEEKRSIATSADTTIANQEAFNNILHSGSPASSPDWDKKIIKTADVTLELKDYQAYNLNLHRSIKRFGAYIASEQQSESDAKIENDISIKVPVDQFEDLINSLAEEGVKVLDKKINTEDVTGEVVDTKARTEARKQVREQYISLLKKAKTMKEILEVQKEVNSIQEDIEAGSGRVEYLSHQASYSTINLNYFQYFNSNVNGDNPSPTFITKLKEAFKDGASIVSGLILIMVTVWPLLFAVFVIWILIKKYSARQVKLIKKEQ